MHHRQIRRCLVLSLFIVVTLIMSVPALAAGVDTLVTVGSPKSPFPRNKQNEPGIAIDVNHPNVVVAGSNDEIDLAPCVGSSCPFTPGVGVSGVYFSFDGGTSWTQPTYTGWTARSGTPGLGPIGTLPWYYENGLVSGGDPVLAFGPVPKNGTFSWANGSRLYYVNLVANFSAMRSERAFKGQEAVAVSRTDDVRAAAAGDKSAWMPPVLASGRLSTTTFSDKNAIWVDNAASSPDFGHAYACWVSFRSFGSAPEPLMVSRSTDGGDTWSAPVQVTAATNTVRTGGRQGCALRTDSKGTVYVFWEGFDQVTKQSVQFMARSFDGGVSFERPRPVATIVDVGQLDPVQGRFTFDGVAGARTDSFPSVDIANGAPSGVGASNTIVMTWADGRNGLNHEQALVQFSTDGGNTWSTPVNGAESSDRPDFPAVAISPDGQDVYLTYDAFLDPWQTTTTAPRRFQGVVRHASATLTGWSTLGRGAIGDARASSANSLTTEFLGDYNFIAASNDVGVAVYNDARNAQVCSAINAYRQSLVNGTAATAPAPAADCPPTFGNTDIFGGPFAP